MADIHGSPGAAPQMPAASGGGIAPVPYGGADLSPEPPVYHAEIGPLSDAAGDVMAGVVGTVESPVAHDIAAGTADAPYYPGAISPIFAGGDNDAGGRDDVAATVAEAVANATARWHEYMGDTGQGSQIGDAMDLGSVTLGHEPPPTWGPFPESQPPSGSFT